jgi:poly-beta-1,6-N-acetyl-D-glucosamine synthase
MEGIGAMEEGNILEKTAADRYISVDKKFFAANFCALLWLIFSIYVSQPWLKDLSTVVSMPGAILIITGIGYIPGYINFFIIVSLLLDHQPEFKITDPDVPVTIVIACRNEEKAIPFTLKYIHSQDYKGEIRIIVVDNASNDKTSSAARKAAEELGLNVRTIYEGTPGKFNALNESLKHIDTKYLITLDADTLLHKSSVRYIVARRCSAPEGVSAVAGAVMVRNSRESVLARLQEWDYFLGIASIKRMQGLYQGTLVAQGAFSLYDTETIKSVGGWPDAIGEDIVLTWNMLKQNNRVYFEPLAVAFTEVPANVKHFYRQRSRWARGMIEALKIIKPWQQPMKYIKYLSGINLVMPYLDIVYTFCWIPGLVLALFGIYWIIGPMTLLVLPLAIMQNYILYSYQKGVFKELNLNIRKNKMAFVLYVVFYQIIMSPISVAGYVQELFSFNRVWK